MRSACSTSTCSPLLFACCRIRLSGVFSACARLPSAWRDRCSRCCSWDSRRLSSAVSGRISAGPVACRVGVPPFCGAFDGPSAWSSSDSPAVTVDSERHATAFGQAGLEGGQQVTVDGDPVLAASFALPVVMFETLLLFRGIRQLLVPVGEFGLAEVQLEPLGHGRIARTDPGQRGLLGRVVVHDGQALAGEGGLHDFGHQQVDPLLPVERTGMQAPLGGAVLEFVFAAQPGIEAGFVPEQLAVRDATKGPLIEPAATAGPHQVRGLVRQLVLVVGQVGGEPVRLVRLADGSILLAN